MRNVYLSVLGTSNYVPCNYCDDKRGRINDVRFVQEATLTLHCRDWTSSDRIFILTTDEAFQKNWKDNGQKNSAQGLQTQIDKLGLQAAAASVSIPSGKSVDEIWEIFNRIYDLLNEGDTIVFDITHAFRSIPMLAIVVLNYAKALKNINLQGIFYGAFEILGSTTSVEKMPLEDRNVPILDLTAFDSLLEWTSAISQFIKSGDARRINEIAQSELKPVLMNQLDLRKTANHIKILSKQLANFSNIMATCRGPEISNIIQTLQKFFQDIAGAGLIPPMKPLLEQIQKEIEQFTDDDTWNGIQAAEWCLEHNMVQQGFTILQETLIACFVKKAGKDVLDKEMRNIVNSAVAIVREQTERNAWTGPAAEHPEITRQFIEILNKNKKFMDLMNQLSLTRNDINHAGYSRQAAAAEKFHQKLRACLNDAKTVLSEELM